jgi:hypothetical protein
MEQTLALSIKQKEFYHKLADDLKYALKDLTQEELWEILKESAIISAKVTYEKKIQTIKQAGAFLKNTYERYNRNGIIESAKSDANKIKDFTLSLPEKTKVVYNNFLKLKREEQIEVIVVTILTVSIYFASAGGADFEGGIPDIDLATGGVAHHRSFITHSILIGLGIEFMGRFSILTLERIKNRMPLDRHKIWDAVYEYIDKHKEKAIAAMWLGIGTHLIKDSGAFGGGVTPYKDLPFSMPMSAHKSLFAANGVASSVFGTNAL